jgi:hypothetical protein
MDELILPSSYRDQLNDLPRHSDDNLKRFPKLCPEQRCEPDGH